MTSTVLQVDAFGGFFGRAPVERPIESSGDAIVFGLLGANKVQLQVQLDYNYTLNGAAAAEDFGWILPLPAVPTRIDMGSSLLFHALFQETMPRFELEIQNMTDNEAAATNRQGSSSNAVLPEALSGQQVCHADDLQDMNCPVQGPTRGSTSGVVSGMQLVAQGHAGWLEYQILQGGTKQDVQHWLETNDFSASNSENFNNLLDYYDAYQSVYVVVKVAAPASTTTAAHGSVQPLLIEYTAEPYVDEVTQQIMPLVHKVPTLLSASPRTLQVYFLSPESNARATPVNYLDVTLDDALVDWVGCLAPESPLVYPEECYYRDYQARFQQAVEPVTHQSFTTEYAGPSSAVLQNKIAMNHVVLANLEASATWLDYLLQLQQAGVPPIPAVQGILDQFIPPKQFQFAPPFECVQWDHVYQPHRTASPTMAECFDIFVRPTSNYIFDPVGLTAALEEYILQPAQQAQNMVDATHQSLTRLYGRLVAPQQTPEPHFVVTTDKPQVSHMHKATAVPICDTVGGSPTALQITLLQDTSTATTTTTTFWQPAILSCPTWKKTSPHPVFTAADAAPRAHSMATLFTAWGVGQNQGLQIPRDNETGLFLYDDVDIDAILATLTTQADQVGNVVDIPGIPTSGNINILDNNGASGEEANASSGGTCNGCSGTVLSALVVAITSLVVAISPILCCHGWTIQHRQLQRPQRSLPMQWHGSSKSYNPRSTACQSLSKPFRVSLLKARSQLNVLDLENDGENDADTLFSTSRVNDNEASTMEPDEATNDIIMDSSLSLSLQNDNSNNQTNPLVRYRGRIAYDGSGFSGFQIQLHKKETTMPRTIQAALEEVLQTRFNRPSIRIVGAGRTDTGVSARGQAFHFDLTRTEHESLDQSNDNNNSQTTLPRPSLDYAMNRMLRTDEIGVWNVGPAPPPRTKTITYHDFATNRTVTQTQSFVWNALYDSTHKLYSYRVCLAPAVMDPIYRFQRWQVPRYNDGQLVNMTVLERILRHYEGTHDFRAFAGNMEQLEKRAQRSVNTTRTVYQCRLIDERDTYGYGEGYYRIDILLSGALYKMVRNMVGTAIDVSCGRLEESEFLQLLQINKENNNNSNTNQQVLGRKNNRSRPAPPQGLTLERVFYDDDDVF